MDNKEYIDWQDEGSACTNFHQSWIDTRYSYFFQHSGMSVLDNTLVVGCRNGYELGLLAGRGYSNLTGIDVSRRMVAVCMIASGFDVRWDDIGNPKTLHGLYDVIVMSHVLEHVLSPIQTLKNCFSLLNQGGFLWLSVPQEPPAISKYHTVAFRDENELRELVKSAGFELVASTFFTETHPPEWNMVWKKPI